MVSTTKPTKVILSLITEENDYQRAHAENALAVAKRFDASLEIQYAENDAVTQVQQILTAIQRRDHGIEAVITEPVGTAMLNVAEVATKAGIGWILLNRDADYVSRLRLSNRAPVFEVSVDQLEVGRIQARQLATLLPGGGAILYITGLASGSTATLRAQGMADKKPVNIQLKTIAGNWTEDGGYRAVTSLLKLSTTKSSGFAAVVSQNDAMAAGARRAFGEIANPVERSGWLDLPFLGVDGLPNTGQAYVQRKLLTATIITPAVAGIALENFLQWKNSGKAVPERILVNSTSYPALESLRPSTRS